jgi:alpha-beta hydrolase superfamily lysophospholipase
MAIMTRGRIAATLLSIGLISAACGQSMPTPAATGGEIPPAPTTTDPRSVVGSDFYAAPPVVPGDLHGKLVRYQKIDLGTPPAGAVPYDAWRILYRSEAANGDAPNVVSGLILAPQEKSSKQRPIVAWAHPTVGSADVCAPSRTFNGKARSSSVEDLTFIDQVQHFMRQGYAVIATDYEGLGTDGQHPFLVGKSAGRSVLDSVVAARQISALNLSDTVVVYGHSQGGHAALFAGELASTWTPELKIAGVVAAAPFAEVEQLLPLASGLPDLAHYYMLGVYGMAAGEAKLNPASVLAAEARAKADQVEKQCLGDFAATVKGILQSSGKSSLMTTDPLTLPEWRSAIQATVPGKTRTGMPILVAQGKTDTTIPAFTTQSLVKRLCSTNGKVQYQEYDAGHGDVVKAADRDIKAFIANRLSGAPFTPTC